MRLSHPMEREIIWNERGVNVRLIPEPGYEILALKVHTGKIDVSLYDTLSKDKPISKSFDLPLEVRRRCARYTRAVENGRTVQTIVLNTSKPFASVG